MINSLLAVLMMTMFCVFFLQEDENLTAATCVYSVQRVAEVNCMGPAEDFGDPDFTYSYAGPCGSCLSSHCGGGGMWRVYSYCTW